MFDLTNTPHIQSICGEDMETFGRIQHIVLTEGGGASHLLKTFSSLPNQPFSFSLFLPCPCNRRHSSGSIIAPTSSPTHSATIRGSKSQHRHSCRHRTKSPPLSTTRYMQLFGIYTSCFVYSMKYSSSFWWLLIK